MIKDFWEKYNNDFAKHVIFIRQVKDSKAYLEFYEQIGNNMWKNTLKCDAIIGKNGLGKQKEGDLKTPIGIYNITMAFGIKENPDTKLKYIEVTDDLYSCSDKIYYNQIISSTKTGHFSCSGEHLIEYVPQYNYAICFDFNNRNIYGLGSSIFLHCKGSKDYTAGCIAIDEENMKCILQKCEFGDKILIC